MCTNRSMPAIASRSARKVFKYKAHNAGITPRPHGLHDAILEVLVEIEALLHSACNAGPFPAYAITNKNKPRVAAQSGLTPSEAFLTESQCGCRVLSDIAPR